MSGLIERLIARGMPPAPADREIGDYLAALRVGRTDVGEAIAHHQETRHTRNHGRHMPPHRTFPAAWW